MGEFSIDWEETLRRLLARLLMMVQGDRCLFMVHHPERRELFAGFPARGFDGVDLSTLRVRDTDGISGEVFTNKAPTLFHDAKADPRAWAERWAEYGVQNGVSAPLVIDIRDEETNQLLGHYTIGVLHVFNTRSGNIFTEDDVQFLERLAKHMAPKVRELYFDRQGAVFSLKAERVDL